MLTDLVMPTAECLSFFAILKCSANFEILLVSNPICISADSTSLSCVAKDLIISKEKNYGLSKIIFGN